MLDAATAERVFMDHRRWVWGLGYRMLGVAADADDLVQDTFSRVMTRPPADQSRSWTPWIMRVATRLAIDRLRARQRAPYAGPWLPAPARATDAEALAATPDGRDPAAAYELAESATLAFLLALEVLTPQQRAVLILRSVFDLSVAQTAEALSLSASNVKVTAHRARGRLAGLQAPSTQGQVGPQIFALFQAVRGGNLADVIALLAPDVEALTDANGTYSAARKPIVGPDAVARFFMGIQRFATSVRVRMALINGLPAMLVERDGDARFAPRAMIQVVVGADGRITRILSLQAPEKLAGVA